MGRGAAALGKTQGAHQQANLVLVKYALRQSLGIDPDADLGAVQRRPQTGLVRRGAEQGGKNHFQGAVNHLLVKEQPRGLEFFPCLPDEL